MSQSKPELIRKVTPKKILGDVKEAFNDYVIGNDPVPVIRVAGIVHGISVGESDYGQWLKFRGDVTAINLLTGKVYSSVNCILPPVAGDLLESAVAKADGSVEYAFDITLKASDTPTGYEYGAIPLIESKESSPVDMLLASVNSQHALPAPPKAKK